MTETRPVTESLPVLPVTAVLGDLARALDGPGVAVLGAAPGSGKTSLAPLSMLDAPWLGGARIVVLEPRRLAARAAAARMAALLGESVGERVGYRVRFDTRVSCATRIEVVTEGVLTRRLQRDPALEGVGALIFDEYHERSVDADLALALALDARRGLREDLRILVMSATLDEGAVSRLLGGAPVVRADARTHPVVVRHLDREPTGNPDPVPSVRRALEERTGDVLAFLPGAREIRALAARLGEAGGFEGVVVRPLYGDLPASEQDSAIRPDPGGGRRVVLATNIAETSLTIEGVTAVVDTGLARVPRFDPNTALTRLETVRISRASAEQRAGRAGRLGPGTCYRLWTEAAHSRLRAASQPEILSADLAALVLELAQWGVDGPGDLDWLDPPPAGACAQARALLESLGALGRDGRLTPIGVDMSGLPVHPRLARMLLAARGTGHGAPACDLAALLEEGDVLGARAGTADIGDRLRTIAAPRARGGDAVRRGALARAQRASRALRARLGVEDGGGSPDDGVLARSLCLAYPDRVARRRGGQRERYLLASGRGARLREDDPLAGSEYLVVPSLDAGREEALVYLAAPLQESDLRVALADRLTRHERIAWDPRDEAVSAVAEERLASVVLGRRALDSPDPQGLADAMLQGVRSMGLECLPWSEALEQWCARVASLAGWRPHEGWPDLSRAGLERDLDAWLRPCLGGVTRRAHLRRLDLRGCLAARLDWSLARRLDEGAPESLRAASGTRCRLDYAVGRAPVMAVRVQEMFGCAETPRVCWGEVAVTLHLLSPARRPLQVTDDLTGFWARTYPEVRKEMKGRYPKHHWPDDPLAAAPTARARPKTKRGR